MLEAHAHACGQPQLRSIPLANGAARVAARENSRAELAPSWTIVGGCGCIVETVKS